MSSKLIETMSRIEKLKAEMIALEAEAEKNRATETQKISDLLDSLPNVFGFEVEKSKNPKEHENAMNMIRGWLNSKCKGTFGSIISGSRTYTVLTDSQKAEIDAALKKGEQVSALASKYGCAAGTVYLRKQALGLTNKRVVAAAAPVAPVKPATASTPAPAKGKKS